MSKEKREKKIIKNGHFRSMQNLNTPHIGAVHTHRRRIQNTLCEYASIFIIIYAI